MEYEDYCRHDGLGLAALVERREVSAAELLEAAITRTEAVDGTVNALSQRLYDFGRAAIARGLPAGPFRGVPFLLKDVGVLLQGTVTTQGSRLYRDFLADHDSTLVERYKRAGVVIFGKTTTPELGLAASTETTLSGTTRNPWDLSRTPGGSSGGAAAAVAAGIVPVAHGSDGGGSIRIPASCCGLFGLKPTRARTPSGPDVGEGWGGLAVNHVISRSVRDSAAMLDATHGPAPGDPYAPPGPGPERPFLAELTIAPGRLRVALQTRPLSGGAVEPECLEAARQAARLLESLGHHVEEAAPPGNWDELSLALWVLVATNVSLAVKHRAAKVGIVPTPETVERATWSAVAFAATLSPEDYPAALAAIHRQGRRMAAFHERYDILMSPTLAQPPVPLGPQHTDNPDQEAYVSALLAFMPFTQLFNMTGQPAMSVPLHWSADGLPVGVQFGAAQGAEGLLFRLASQLEQACPWADRRPEF